MKVNIHQAILLCCLALCLNNKLHAQTAANKAKKISPLYSCTSDNGEIIINNKKGKATYKNASGAINKLIVSNETYAFRKKKDIIKKPVQLNKSAIFIERSELGIINTSRGIKTLRGIKSSKNNPGNDRFTISMIVHFDSDIEDGTTLWEFYNETDQEVNMGLYVNKDSSLYLELSRANLNLSHYNISGKQLNYKLPIYAPARVDSNCPSKKPQWFRITTIFTPFTVLVYISKPCETYYKGNGELDYTINRDLYKAQDNNHGKVTDLGAGYGGNYGNLAEQYYWTGNEQQNGWTHFVVGDKACKQSTKIDIYKIDFFDVTLVKNQVKALDR